MKAKIEVTNGAVRIFSGGPTRPGAVAPVSAPHSAEVETPWAVGSASTPGTGLAAGEFTVEALEDGELRVFDEEKDPSTGSVTNSTASHQVAMTAGEKLDFETHDSNAYTVQAETPVSVPTPAPRGPLNRRTP